MIAETLSPSDYSNYSSCQLDMLMIPISRRPMPGDARNAARCCGNAGRYWEVPEGTGGRWEMLGDTGRYWEVPEGTEGCWEMLGDARRYREVQEGTGGCWEMLRDAGRY